LIGFEPLIFELSTFIFGKGKREKKPLRMGYGFGSGRLDLDRPMNQEAHI